MKKCIFLLLSLMMLVGCSEKIVYKEKIVYRYPDSDKLEHNGVVEMISVETYMGLNPDEKLKYLHNLIIEYRTKYNMCTADKWAIEQWMEQSKSRLQESTSGQKP